jgi:hypothetical protein
MSFAPVFPTAYVAIKMNKLVLSGGFMPIGGGGSATFDKRITFIRSTGFRFRNSLASIGVTDYKIRCKFRRFINLLWNAGVCVSYKINDLLSVYGGARYVMASNSYVGYLKDIQFIVREPGKLLMHSLKLRRLQQLSGDAINKCNKCSTPSTTPLSVADPTGQLAAGLQAFGYDPTGMDIGTAAAY